MPIQVPKLSLNSSNWVVYCDRLRWAMQTNTFMDLVVMDAPSTAYVAFGDIGRLTLNACWVKEENTIKLVLGSTLPDTTFNRIKTTANVCDAWEILKRRVHVVLIHYCLANGRELFVEVSKVFKVAPNTLIFIAVLVLELLDDVCDQCLGPLFIDLLTSLPASYDSTVSSISASTHLGSKVLTAEIFKQFIIDKSEHCQVKNDCAKA